jgi:chemotaxis protein methyltransferase CheR
MTVAMSISAPASANRLARADPPADLDSLSSACGLRLGAYRAEHVGERIERALEREPAGSPAELAALLRRSREARDRFRRAIAISVTGRFRDPHQFDVLRQRVLPHVLAGDRGARIWSAGCSTGLELYGVAELLESFGALGRAHMLGSDLLEENIATARAGGGDGVPVPAAVAAAIRWEVRDLLDGVAPSGTFKLVLCRNVGIYFAPAARAGLMAMLAAGLAPGGFLMLGRSERLAHPERLGLEPHAPHVYRSTR